MVRRPPGGRGRDDEIIDVDDWRIVEGDERSGLEPVYLEPEQEHPPRQEEVIWVGGPATVVGGGGCCLGLSATVLLIGLIFFLGLVATCWLIWTLLDWAIPFF